eukprot:3129127-Pyramimonas_sp.AAC.2
METLMGCAGVPKQGWIPRDASTKLRSPWLLKIATTVDGSIHRCGGKGLRRSPVCATPVALASFRRGTPLRCAKCAQLSRSGVTCIGAF